MRRILVVEPDEPSRQAAVRALRGAGFVADGVGSAAEAARALDAGGFDAVLSARTAARAAPSAPASASASAAGPPSASASALDDRLVGASPPMRALKTAITRVAPHKTTVLLRGESGTGKEVAARALHDLSPRAAAGPFVAVNCAAIPAGLLESELFGHRKGAFTDAVRDRQGLVEQARGGTLLLDEIAELPPPLQVKLLRVLQDQRVRPVGGEADVEVDVRVVAATSRALEEEVAAGRFRQDLLYRLDVVTLLLPPLRARVADIPALAARFLERARARLGVAVTSIAPEAMRLLAAYGWPGNVRELENTIERAVVLCEGEIVDAASLPERVRAPGAAPGGERRAPSPDSGAGARDGHDGDPDLSIKRAARRAEEALIRRTLARTSGNRTRAAELLDISHRALLYKIKEYGIV